MGFPRLISDPASLARFPCGSVLGAAREPGAAGEDAPGPGPARPGPTGAPGRTDPVPAVPQGSFCFRPCRRHGVLVARRSELMP